MVDDNLWAGGLEGWRVGGWEGGRVQGRAEVRGGRGQTRSPNPLCVRSGYAGTLSAQTHTRRGGGGGDGRGLEL